MVLKVCAHQDAGAKTIIFFSHWSSYEQFKGIVQKVWTLAAVGSMMSILFHKLKNFRKELRNFNQGDKEDINKSDVLRRKLTELQKLILLGVADDSCLQREQQIREELCLLTANEEKVLRQKSRLLWLRYKDQNPAYVHKATKARQCKNHIRSLTKANGQQVDDIHGIKVVAVHYFQTLLGSEDTHVGSNPIQLQNTLKKTLSTLAIKSLDAPISRSEIKSTLFSLYGNKAQSPDGFNAQFFNDSRDIVGDSVLFVIEHFFITGRLDKQVNVTILALIPKKLNAASIMGYRAISYYTTIYKCIAKLLANMLKKVPPELIRLNQAAFISRRSISDNILLIHELVCNYHRTGVSPRAAIKIDLHKAFDSLNWDFIVNLLSAKGFLSTFITWIRRCIVSSWFSVSINSSLSFFF